MELRVSQTRSDPSPPASSPAQSPTGPESGAGKPRRKRHWLRALGILLLLLVVAGGIVRVILPSTITWYVNRTLDQSPLYDGKVDDVDLHLYRGAYTIKNVRIIKTTGSVPVPLFEAPEIQLAVSWNGLRHGKVVGDVEMIRPQVNFVDGPSAGGDSDDAGDQTGVEGPWLKMLRELFPFRINRVQLTDGSVHFRTYPPDAAPVDVYLSELDATVDNLTNIQDETQPMITTVQATALAMGSARFEYQMKLDPFSYKPTFHMMARLLSLDVTKLNDLTRTYGSFDFAHGWFDLVIELDAREGFLRGYTKPLFRELEILTMDDVEEDHFLQVFWEALVGGAERLLRNQGRDQFGTLIPFTGQVDGPRPDVLETVGNVLRNGFIRAYLPKFQSDPAGGAVDGLQFEPPQLSDPVSFGDDS